MELDSPVTPADRVGLGIEVRPDGDARRLYLASRKLFGWLDLSELELRIPSSAAEDAERPAIAYQRIRSDVVSAQLGMTQADIDLYVSGLGGALANLGVDELVLRCSDAYVGLSARVREAALVADLSARIYLSAYEDQLRISIGHPRVYGHLDTPAPILAHHLVAALLRTSETDNVRAPGLCDFLLHPLRSALFHSLPAAGWRLPNLRTTTLAKTEITGDGVRLYFSEQHAMAQAPSQAAAALVDALEQFRGPDTLLHEGDIEGAMRGYRGELAARGPEQPFLVERILSIASARREYFMDGLELARQVLGRWPDFPAAHAAIASIGVAQGDIETAAARYRELSEASAAVGDEEGTVRAALAGARLLRQFAPDDSTRLYEVVLEHRPGHAESAEALADRYRDEERWPDLVRLIRMRLAATQDPQRQARDHARLAEVLVAEQDDPEAALAELAAACRLDASIPQVYEQRAEVEFLLGNVDEALESLEHAAELYRAREDARAQLRTLIRAGEGCLAAGRFETAESKFLEALEIAHGHVPAMRGAARAAAALGRYDAAARLWRELFDAGIEAPAVQAYFACELGRNLLAANAPHEAVAPLERASETGGPRTKGEALALIGKIHMEAGAVGEALDAWHSAIEAISSVSVDEAHPKESDTRATRQQRAAEIALQCAAAQLERGNEDAAMESLARAFDDSRPGSAARREAARRLLERTPSNEGKLSWLHELIAGNADWDECAYLHIRKANILAAEGDPQASLEVLEHTLSDERISANPKSAALAAKAAILETMGDVSARADVLEERATLSGSEGERGKAFVESAEGWLLAGDMERCRTALRLALQLVDDEPQLADVRKRAYLCLAECAWRARRWEEVHEAYGALYESPEKLSNPIGIPREGLLRWGIALENLGDAKHSIAVLERVANDDDEMDHHGAQACRHLATLHERLGELARAAAFQERYAAGEASALSGAAQADAWYQAGALHRRIDGGADDAKRCLDTALRVSSDHLPALDALEQIARNEGAHERLAVILGRKVAVMAAHPGRQRGLLLRLAKLQEETLGRPDVARETYRRILAMTPSFRPALRFAARDALQGGNYGFASEALQFLAGPLELDEELSMSPEELEEERTEALHDLATLVVESDGQVASKSITALLRAEARERDEFRLWFALAAAYRRQADIVGLADALGQLIKHAEPQQALELSLERIQLLVNEIGDHGGALIALRIAEGISPENEELARWHDELSDEGREQRARSAQPSAAPARTHPDAEAPPDRATIAKARELIDNGNWDAALQLLSPYDRAPDGQELLWLHVEAALGAGRAQTAIRLLPRIAEAAKTIDDVAGEHRATRRLADLMLETEGAEDVALTLYKRALALDPTDQIAAELCAELESNAAERVSSEGLVEDTIPSENSGPTNEALALRARARNALGSGRLNEAIALLEEALSLAPHMAGLHRECAELALAADDSGKAVHWLEALVARIESGNAGHAQLGENMSDLHLQLADLYYGKLASPPRARAHMRAAAKAAGSELRRAATLRQLASEAASSGCPDEAIEAYEAIGLENLSGHERLAAAKLYQELGRDHASIELLESARVAGTLNSEGRSLLFSLHRNRSRNQGLAEALERGARSAPVKIAATRLREALRIYEHVLNDAESTARIRQALTSLESAAGGGEEGRTLAELEWAADDATANNDPDVAASLLSRAIQTSCHDLGAAGKSVDAPTHLLLTKLRNQVLHRRSGSQVTGAAPSIGPSPREVHALVRALAAVSNIEDNLEAAASLLREIALLRRNELHDIRGAADAMAQALTLKADDASILAELADMLREAGDHTQLASAYELHLSTISGPRRAAPLLELGQLCHHVFGEQDRALRCYEEALELDPGVAEQVKALREALGDVTEFTNHADLELSAELDRALAMESLGRHAEAQEIYESSAALAPQDPRPFLALRRIYRDRGEASKLARVLEQLTTLSSSRHDRAALFYDRAILARDEFHDEVLVYEYLKEAAANDPDDPRYSHALRTIAMARAEWALAAELTYREISACEDKEELGALYLELALIFDEKLLDPPQALANYEQALRLDPSIPAAPRPLARLYELASRHHEAAEMYQKASALSPDPNERGRLLRHAAMNAEQAGLSDLAKALYEKVAKEASEGDRRAAMDAAERIKRDGRGGEAVESASRALGRTIDEIRARLSGHDGDDAERAHLLFELGQAYQHDLHDLNAAMTAYEESLALSPNQLDAKDALADLCYMQRNWPRAHYLYHDIDPQESSLPPAQVVLRQAEAAEAIGNEEEAYTAFRNALEFSPTDTKILAGLCRSASRVGEHAEAIAAQEALVRLISIDDVERIQAARVFLADLNLGLGNLEGAIKSYEELLSDVPDSMVAKRELPRLYQQARMPEHAATALRELIQVTPDHSERAELLYELGEVQTELSDDPDLAAEAYFRAIDLNPEHVPTLHRLLTYYCDTGDFQATAEIAADLQRQSALLGTQTSIATLYRAALSSAIAGDRRIARTIGGSLGAGAPEEVARAIRGVYELPSGPPIAELAEAAKTVCDAAGEDLAAVASSLSNHESAKDLDRLVSALAKLAV